MSLHEKKSTDDKDGDIAAVSIHSKIPPFWRENPRLWFAHFEAIVAYQKLGEDQKYSYVLSTLEQRDIEQISDIILNPQPQKYTALKTRLLSIYEESESRQLQKLLSGVELGDYKPSQLLRKMRDLAASRVPDETLRVMWMGHLPTYVRSVLSISKEAKLDELSSMADRMMEQHEPTTIAAISGTHSNKEDDKYEQLLTQITELKLEIAQLRYGRKPERFRLRSRSKSLNRRNKNYGKPHRLCYYHHRFGDKARKCVEPCEKKQSEN